MVISNIVFEYDVKLQEPPCVLMINPSALSPSVTASLEPVGNDLFLTKSV